MKSKIMNSFSGIIVVLMLAGIMPMSAFASEIQVKMINAQFTPTAIQVKVGDTVLWKNEDSFNHTITGFGIDETVIPGGVVSHMFNEAGTFDYKCAIHTGMKGKVIVSDGTTAPVVDAPADVTLSEYVTADNVIEVVSADIAGVNDETAQKLIAQAVDEIVKMVNKEKIEDIASSIENITQKAEKAMSEPEAKIAYLKELLSKIRAQVIVKNETLTGMMKKELNLPKLYEVRWGDLEGVQKRCTGMTIKDLRDSLDKGDVPAECEDSVNKVQYDGTISVDRGELDVRKEIQFNRWDRLTDSSGSSVSFASGIAENWKGLIVEYIPPKDDTAPSAPLNITIKIGDLNKVFSVDDAIGQKSIGNGHMIEIKNLAQVVPGLALGLQKNLLTDKLKLEEKIVEIRNKLNQIRLLKDVGVPADELDSVLDDTGKYNFDSATAASVQSEIDKLNKKIGLDTTSDDIKSFSENLKSKIEELKSQAKDLKFAQKTIPFKDTDDGQWYTDYVSAVKNQGIISGYKDASGNELGEYRPGNNVTVAEILKIGLETAGKGKGSGKPTLQSALNHWAKDYVAKAEELGLDIVKGDTSLDRPATRSEVIRMMLESLGIMPDPISSTDFSDVEVAQSNDTGAAAYIQYAKKLGIVSGDSGTTTFRPSDPINRAEVAKIANQIIDILFGGSISAISAQ